MKVVYSSTLVHPAESRMEAVMQEMLALKQQFNGEIVKLFPFAKPYRLPTFFYGFHHLLKLKRLDAEADFHQIYTNRVHPFPIFNQLKKPIILNLTNNTLDKAKLGALKKIKSLRHIVVSTPAASQPLQEAGFRNYSVIGSGINVSRFSHSPLPIENDIVLLCASAPWLPEQFDTKGVNLLLEAAKKLPFLKIIFLWRGVLYKEMLKKVKAYNVEQQVTVINKMSDVNQMLAKVHATVLFAKNAGIVKSWPNSLMESIAAGKPVISNTVIPISKAIKEKQFGIILDEVNTSTFIEAIQILKKDYQKLQHNALQSKDYFSQQAVIERYQALYQQLASNNQ